MIISHKHKYIFIKCMKTAGTSIQVALAEQCGPNDIISSIGNIKGFAPQNECAGCNPHATPKDIKALAGEVVWNSYLKIIGVRNPWDLMVSWWHWHLKPCGFTEFVKKELKVFDNFLLTDQLFDFYIRFEHLQEDFDKVCNHLKLPKTELPHLLNFRKAAKHYSTYYTPELVELVNEHYRDLIDYFGYEFEKPI